MAEPELKCPNMKNERVSVKWCRESQYKAWCEGCANLEIPARVVSEYQRKYSESTKC